MRYMMAARSDVAVGKRLASAACGVKLCVAQLSKPQHLSSASRRSLYRVLHGVSVRQRENVSMFVTGRALEAVRVSPNAAERGSGRAGARMGQRVRCRLQGQRE